MSGIGDLGDIATQQSGRTVATLIRAAPLLPSTMLCGAVAEMFQADSRTSTFVVQLDAGGFGLVERTVFLPNYLGGFNREIFQRKPIVQLLDADPLVVDENDSIEQVALIVTSERPDLLKSAFIITDRGDYCGIGLGTDLMRAVAIRAQAASVAKSTFLANMSHEIRTPLNAVIGNLELLAETPMNAEQLRLAAMAEISANALLDLIGDLLDLSKIEADRFDVEAIETDIRGLVQDVLAIALPRARLKGLKLVGRVGHDVPATILSDPTRLRQVLINFIGNSVKFTEAGTIILSVMVSGGSADRCDIRFDVIDTGIGFAPSRAQALFEPFVQEDMTTTRRFGGTGLGLTISKKIAELFGGSIGCAAEPGLGANFWIVIPAAVVLLPESRPPPDLSGEKVLLVGGSPLWQSEIQDYLALFRFVPDATVIRDTLAPPSAHWAAIVAHVSSDRDDVTDEDLTRLAGLTPRLVVLADIDNDPAIRYRAYRAGASYVLADPKDLGELPYLLAPDVATGQGLGPTDHGVAEPATVPIWADPRPLLVIDDTATNRELAVRQLGRLGLACDVAENGQVGLAMACAGDYALILVDGSMPVMDGPGFAGHYRVFEQQRGGGRTPVIAMTAHALAGDAERFLASGMDDYLAKPVTLQKLDRMLRKWLREQLAEEVPARLEQRESSIGGIDFAALVALLGEADPEVLTELLNIFVADFPMLIEAAAQALAEADRPGLARAAHAAKSAAGSAGAPALTSLLQRLEQGASETSFAELADHLTAVDHEFRAIVSQIGRDFRNRSF